MKQFILVFIGGGFGSTLRYLIGKLLNSNQTGIPYGTFVANILGSLLIGIILGLAAKNDSLTQNQTLFLATGFCGGFTTFSTFAYENHVFLKSGDFTSFAIYTITSFIVGFLAVFLGMYLVK
ncbi:fluoride efflux transporter CrcB [Winogradskyella sp. HB-48]|uniref:fluoride efflux transporter CrcB n=1 Tax=Winogradskyella sp. HB-48 TaxID=3416808 RepID=UPI003CF8DA66